MKDRVVLVLAVLCVLALNVPSVALGAEVPLGDVTVIGDLDGDGAVDLLSIRSRSADPVALGEDTVEEVTAVKGSDGSALWSIDLPSAFYTPTRLGDGGILLVGYAYTGGTAFGTNVNGYETTDGCCVTGAGSVSTYVFVLDADGAQRWERTFEDGSFAYAENRAFSQQLAVFRGTLGASNGKDMTIISIYDREPTPEGQQDQVTTMVIDNSTGTTLSTNQLDIDGRRTIIRRVGDLSQDGVDDYAIDTERVGTLYVAGNNSVAGEFELPPQEHQPRILHAIDSVTGQELWTSSIDEGNPEGLTRVGDVVGNGAPDLALDRAGLEESDGTETIPLIDGSSGQVVGEIPGQVAVGAPDADVDEKGEILAVDYIRDGAARRLSYSLYAPDGTVLRSESHSVEVPANGVARLTPHFDAGDVDGDGFTDLSHRLWVESSSAQNPSDERVISGTDGRTIRVGATGTPLRSSADATGDDFYSVAAVGETSARDLTVLDGLSGTELWTDRLSPLGEDPTTLLQVDAGDFDGDGSSDLLVQASSSTEDPTLSLGQLNDADYVQFFVLSGADGHLLWEG